MASDLMNPVQCNICEKAAAKFNCNTCGDVLCVTCKAHHLKSRATGDHKIVPYTEKLNPKYITQLFCSTHHNHASKFWCDTCGTPICDSCITNQHRGHKLNNITAVLTEKRDQMLEYTKKLRDKTVNEWIEVLKQVKATTVEYFENTDKVEEELKARAKDIHSQVDAILLKSQQTLKQMKVAGLKNLQDQEKYLEDKLQQLKRDVERYENQLLDTDPYALLQFEGTESINKETKPPALEITSALVFIKGQNDYTSMQSMFGQFSTQKSEGVDEKLTAYSLPNPTVTPSEQTKDLHATVTPSEQTKDPLPLSSTDALQKSIVSHPSVQTSISVDNIFPRIACAEQGLAWVNTESMTLQLLDKKGIAEDTISTDFTFNDMAVTSTGDIILADSKNSCIKLVSSKKRISTLFRTIGHPTGICCLNSNDIVLTFSDISRVAMYSKNGTARSRFDHIKFNYPLAVSVNKLNKDIYICDHEDNYHTFYGKEVITVASNGQLRYKYTGQGDRQFVPTDVCSDDMGHILITDYGNHRVNILDQEGQFIRHVLTSKPYYALISKQSLSVPTTIDVDNEGFIWVGEYNKCVKVAKYLL